METIFILLLIAVGLFFVEIFAPGGLFAIAGCVLIVAAAVLGFRDFGVAAGVYVLIGGGAVAAVLFLLELKLVIGTRFGANRFALSHTHSTNAGTADFEALVGKDGEALTRMTPGGRVVVEGKAYPAVSLDGFLPKGTAIRVSEADLAVVRVSKI